jgi:hypothetical protein
MKKIVLVLFFNFILLNQTTSAQKIDGVVFIPSFHSYTGSWQLKGEKLLLELYSHGKEIERFCKIVFYDDQRRQLSITSISSDPIILLPKTISQFEKKIDDKDVRKTERLIIETCNGIVVELNKQRSSINKTLDKILGK